MLVQYGERHSGNIDEEADLFPGVVAKEFSLNVASKTLSWVLARWLSWLEYHLIQQ